MSIAVTIATILIIGGIYYALYRTKNQSMIEKLTVWLIFSVILALLPVLFNAVLTFIKGQTPSFAQLLQKGELLIIAVAIGADATGKLVGTGSGRKVPKILASGGCIILILLSSLLFSAISTNSLGASFDPARVAFFSSFVFLMTVIAGGSCTLLAEV